MMVVLRCEPPPERRERSRSLGTRGKARANWRLAAVQRHSETAGRSFGTLLKEVESLGEIRRRKLLAFKVVLEDRGNAAYAEKLTRKIDDATPGRWLTPEQCVTELGLPDDPL